MPFNQTHNQAQLNVLKNTAYSVSQLTTAYLGVHLGSAPSSVDGSGGNDVSGTRPSITFGSPTLDGATGRYYIANTNALSFTLTNTSPGMLTSYGIYGASTGGSSHYSDQLPSPIQVAAKASVTIPVGAIRVYAQ